MKYCFSMGVGELKNVSDSYHLQEILTKYQKLPYEQKKERKRAKKIDSPAKKSFFLTDFLTTANPSKDCYH